MKSKILENSTKISFISLATIPLLKENANSILIILCVVLTITNIIKLKSFKPFKKEYWLLTTLFWIYLFHEIIFLDFNFGRILRYLPFLIFPLLFYYRPAYINTKIKKTSIIVFQISTLLQCLLFLFLFIEDNSISQLFYVGQSNIPFFREYVFNNYLFKIHPTYFSVYLLVSFTISLFTLLYEKNKKLTFTIPNIILTVFFIFLFLSRMVFVILFVTIISAFINTMLKRSIKESTIIFVSSIILLVALTYPSRNIIKDRFDEIKTEINKPIVGSYYNSINTRVAIIKCSTILLNQVPFFGFGDELQKELNDCYGRTNDSEFYKISTFNTHNYYLNLILYGGWIFFIVFLIYIVLVYKNIKYSTLGLFLLAQFLLINLTENYFSRHYGVVLFTYFTSLIIFIHEKNEKLHT